MRTPFVVPCSLWFFYRKEFLFLGAQRAVEGRTGSPARSAALEDEEPLQWSETDKRHEWTQVTWQSPYENQLSFISSSLTLGALGSLTRRASLK